MKERLIIAGNWKMNKTVPETLEFITDLEKRLKKNPRIEVLIFPPLVSLYTAAQVSTTIKTGIQNIYFEDPGAFTGETCAAMVKDICQYVLVGHSERRHIFMETDLDVNKKIKKTLEQNLIPVFCLGETEEERNLGNTFTVIQKQLEAGLSGLTAGDISLCVLAYEPVWAIGTGKTATPEQAQEVHGFIRSFLDTRVSESKTIPILYGGSVKPANSYELLSQKDIDGALIGGASLQVEDFFDIIQKSLKVVKD